MLRPAWINCASHASLQKRQRTNTTDVQYRVWTMDSEPIVPPEDDMSYIPTIQHSSSSVESSLQVPTIRYTPATAHSSSSIPLLSSSRTILAADATPFIQGFQYRATLVQQVHFQYPTPPTPPVEGCSGSPADVTATDKPLQSPIENLPMSQGAMEGEGSKTVNPFPSLPTPPDVQDLQQDHQHQMQLVPQSAMYTKQAPTRFRMPPPFNESMSPMPFSMSKSPSLQQSMFCYSAPPMGDPKMMMQVGSPRPELSIPIPPLLKDGELWCVFKIGAFGSCFSTSSWLITHVIHT